MTDIEKIADRSAAGIALAYRSGEADPVAVTECLLARIDNANRDNIFITITAKRAREEANASKIRYARCEPLSPLDGVPVGWKDLFDVAGSPTTAGSKLLSGGPVKTADMPCVANLATAGMVSVGKLNMTELAYSGLGLNPHYGTPINPNDRVVARSPGGSSSGAGAAVAAHLLPCAIGTDTGGSVRIPASFNGVVGFKSSTGRIDKTGLVPLARTYDTIGPLARSVEDCILLDLLMRGDVVSSVRRAALKSLTVVAPTNVVLEDIEPAVSIAYERSLEALSSQGVRVRRERVEALDRVIDMTARFGTLVTAESYTEYRDIADSDKAKELDRRVLSGMIGGRKMSAVDVLSIQRGRQAIIPMLATQLDGALLTMPTTVLTAPKIAPLDNDDELFQKVNMRTLRNTSIGNVLDLCAIALPNGRDENGLPTSILFSALHGQDDNLLGSALAIEDVTREFFRAG